MARMRPFVLAALVLAVISAPARPAAGADDGSDRIRHLVSLAQAASPDGGGRIRAASASGFADATGDVPDGRGDVRVVAATYGFESVTLAFSVVSPGIDPTTDPTWTDGFTGAFWVIDVDFDGSPDYIVVMVAPEGNFEAIVLRASEGEGDGEELCSGVPVFNGFDGYTVTFPASCIGFPPDFAFGMIMIFDPDPGNPDAELQFDLVPDDADLLGPIVRDALPAPVTSGRGYWIGAADGGVFAFGDADFHGSTGNLRLNQPVLGMAPTPTGQGYWLVAADGGIFALGDAQFFGSTGNMRLNQPVVAMVPTLTGKGYWLVARDGGIFAFGDAGFFGSGGNLRLAAPIVGMAITPTGRGYWMVARDGGIFAFGDAAFQGSAGNLVLAAPIRGMAVEPGGGGYWMVADDGGLFAFGSARFFGSGVTEDIKNPLIAPTRTGSGYWLLDTRTGRVAHFGDAPALPHLAGTVLNQPIVAFARTP